MYDKDLPNHTWGPEEYTATECTEQNYNVFTSALFNRRTQDNITFHGCELVSCASLWDKLVWHKSKYKSLTVVHFWEIWGCITYLGCCLPFESSPTPPFQHYTISVEFKYHVGKGAKKVLGQWGTLQRWGSQLGEFCFVRNNNVQNKSCPEQLLAKFSKE